LPVVTDRLGDRENMSLGERSAQWRAAMPAGAKTDPLLGIVNIGPALKIFAFETGQIDQHLFRRGLAGEWRNGHELILLMASARRASLKPGGFPRPEGRSAAGSLPCISAGRNCPSDRNGQRDRCGPITYRSWLSPQGRLRR